MIKKIAFISLLALCSSSVLALDDDCEAAVDAASRINPNDDIHCDYSNTGLNGVLHRAFAKKSDSTNDEAANSSKESSKAAVSADTKVPSVNSEFTSAQQLQNLRYALIQKTAQECAKGFVVEGERYLPGVKGMTLELIYHCL